MMSTATVASLVFFAFSLTAAAAVEFLMKAFAEEAGVNRWVFAMVPALLSMLFAMIVFQNAERKIRQVGQSVSRGILVMLLTWIVFSSLVTWTWCQPRQFFNCLGTTLMVSGVVGGGPMLLSALGAGVLTGVLIIRRPKPRIE
jgi:hypothetical protein